MATGREPDAQRVEGEHKLDVLAELLPKLAEPDRQIAALPIARPDRRHEPRPEIPRRVVDCLLALSSLADAVVLVVKPPHLMTDEELEATRRAEVEYQRQITLGSGHLHLVNEEPK